MPTELPTQAMKNKEDKEKKKAKLVSDIEDVMKELQASLEQDNIIFERIRAIDKTKAVVENLVDDIQFWTKKKMFQIESERGQTVEIVARLMARFRASFGEWSDMFDQEIDDLEPLISKEEHVRCLLDRLPKRQRNQMEARYSRPLEQVQALIARTASHKIFIKKIGDVIRKNESSTSEDVSSFKHSLPSQPSSSSSTLIMPT
ncbi:uncharacterized protein [Rutidosis leptorrhynchoides]|uniref:uncharacterized protein n=1 Tax=Rutidosis leptorrhynchoides TaxID=125765 RepID=UPI003A9A429D